MAKAAQRKPKKPVAKAAAKRPAAKPKPKRKRVMATTKYDTPTATPTEVVPPVDLLTEQEQNVYSEGGNGVGPAPASVASVPIETMEDLGIGPRDPYPSADTPPPITRDSKKGTKK